MEVVEALLLKLFVALIVLAGVAVAGYFILRRIFLRAADRMSHHISQALGEIATSDLGTRMSATATRVATGRLTNLAAYAAAQGVSEDVARAQFTRSIER